MFKPISGRFVEKCETIDYRLLSEADHFFTGMIGEMSHHILNELDMRLNPDMKAST